MGSFRKQEDRRQGLLLPPSPSDWLPENHLAWFIIDAVEELDLDAVLAKYRTSGKGEQAYPPARDAGADLPLLHRHLRVAQDRRADRRQRRISLIAADAARAHCAATRRGTATSHCGTWTGTMSRGSLLLSTYGPRRRSAYLHRLMNPREWPRSAVLRRCIPVRRPPADGGATRFGGRTRTIVPPRTREPRAMRAGPLPRRSVLCLRTWIRAGSTSHAARAYSPQAPASV